MLLFQVYDPTTDNWTLTTSMPEPAKCITSISVNNSIFVVGGTLCHILIFDARNKMWSTFGDALAFERASCGMTLCNDQVRYLFNGFLFLCNELHSALDMHLLSISVEISCFWGQSYYLFFVFISLF